MHAVLTSRIRALVMVPPLVLLAAAADPDAPVDRTPEALAAFARAHSPRARAAALERAAAARSTEGAGAWLDPMLEVRAAPLSVPGLLPVAAHDAMPFGAEIMLAQRLPLSGRVGHEHARAAALAVRADAVRDVLLLDVDRDAALLSCNAWESAAFRRVRARHVEVLRALADVTRAQIAAGRASVGDAQRVDAEVVRLSIDVLWSEGELAANDAETNALLGRAPSAPLPAPGEAVPWLLAEPALVHGDDRAELRAGAAELAAGEAERASAADAWIPDVTASVGWSSMWPLSHALMLGVAAELPVFNGGKSADLDAADLMRERARAELDDRRLRATAVLAAARARDDTEARTLALLHDKVLPLVAARAQTARAALSGGAALDAALDATHEEREAELELVRASGERCRSRAELWRAAGVSFVPSPVATVMP